MKEEKVHASPIKDILQDLMNDDNMEKAETLYKVANNGETILGKYEHTSMRASKVDKVPKPITPTKPSRETSKKMEATKVEPKVLRFLLEKINPLGKGPLIFFGGNFESQIALQFPKPCIISSAQ